MTRILLVEDDLLLNQGIAYALRKEGYLVDTVDSIKKAWECLNDSPSLVLLDINLPDGDGREFLEMLRVRNPVPVIFLTARDSEKDMIAGFDAGCDDYMTKPFSIPVLLRKVLLLLRRSLQEEQNLYYQDSLLYDFDQKRLTIKERMVKLTATEVRLLEYFLHNKGRVLTREQILEKVWDTYENFVDEKTLNVNIRRLREKIEENPKNPRYICTVFGIGYKWNTDRP